MCCTGIILLHGCCLDGSHIRVHVGLPQDVTEEYGDHGILFHNDLTLSQFMNGMCWCEVEEQSFMLHLGNQHKHHDNGDGNQL